MVYRKVYYRNIVFIIEIEEDWYFRFVLFFNNKFFECEIKYLNEYRIELYFIVW